MNVEVFRSYCISKAAVTEEFPFGEETLVFKVMGKLFALTSIFDVPGSCNLKCDPERAEELREKYSAITPGFHMNKKHWNTVIWDGSISDPFIFELIDHSYELVIAGLPKKIQDEFSNAINEKSRQRLSAKKSSEKKQEE